MTITIDDPRNPGPLALLERHLEFCRANTPPEHVHALDVEALRGPEVTFFSLTRDGQVLAVGALKELDPAHSEIKSMHTSAAARGQGAGRAMLDHLLGVARERGYARVSLETGTSGAFAAARELYVRAGFAECPPFGAYTESPDNVHMTLVL